MNFFEQKLFATSFVVAMAMVAFEVSPVVAIFSLCILIWKWGSEKKSWKPLNRRTSNLLSVALLAFVWMQHQSLIGQEPAFTFLLGLAALRVSDYRTERDHKFLVLLGFVLIAARALFSVDIYWLVPSAFVFYGLWFSMLPFQLPQRNRVLAKVLLLSLPLTLVLFIVFPRLVLPWAIARGGETGQIGFADDMNPGSVAEIAANSQVAFRAKMSEVPLRRSQELYWRASVLNQSKGLAWSQGGQFPLRGQPHQLSTREQYYDVALEATGQNYLFVLEGTQLVEMEYPGAVAWSGEVFKSRRPLNKASFYRSYWEPKPRALTTEEMALSLEHPELKGRVSQWVEANRQGLSIEQRLERLQDFFSNSGFRYSLKPGFYDEQGLESFLFDRKVGFCEHFAGAYATLARALGVPARVVIGYQGGFYNPLGDFWKIGQKDAHAWVEVALDGKWQKIDPTLWVAPLRLIIGAEAFFSLSEEDQVAFAQSVNWRPPAETSWMWFKDMGFLIEDLNYRWSYFLLDFDRGAQLDFIQTLKENWKILLPLVFLILFGMLWLIRSLLRGTPIKLNNEQLLLQVIENWGSARKQGRVIGETPLQYFVKLQKEIPEQKEILTRSQAVYESAVYQGQSDNAELSALLREWKKLSK